MIGGPRWVNLCILDAANADQKPGLSHVQVSKNNCTHLTRNPMIQTKRQVSKTWHSMYFSRQGGAKDVRTEYLCLLASLNSIDMDRNACHRRSHVVLLAFVTIGTHRSVGGPSEEETGSGYFQRRSTVHPGPVRDVPILASSVFAFSVSHLHCLVCIYRHAVAPRLGPGKCSVAPWLL